MCGNIHHLVVQGHWELEDVPVVTGREVGTLDGFQLPLRRHTLNQRQSRASGVHA